MMNLKLKNSIIVSGILFFLFVAISNGFGQINKFKYYAPLTGVDETQYQSVPLNSKILAQTKNDWNDFRILQVTDHDTIETPFIFNWLQEEWKNKTYNASIINQTRVKGKYSSFVLKFNENYIINEINLSFEELYFDKRITLEGSYDGQTWETIATNMRIIGFEKSNFYYTKLEFSESKFPYYKVVINDEHSSPIHVISADTRLYKFKEASYSPVKIQSIKRTEIKKDESKKVYENKTVFEVKLPELNCIHHIRVKCKDTIDFYRRVSVCNSKLVNMFEGNLTSFGKECTLNVSTDLKVLNDFTVVIDHNDNQALNDIEIEVYGQNAELVAQLNPDNDYILCYSSNKVNAPVFDLQYFTAKIPDVKNKVIVGEINEVKPKVAQLKKVADSPMIKEKMWLWVVLIVLVLLLGGFAYSMTKKV